MTIEVRHLTKYVGAEIGRVDLSQPLSEADVKAIRAAWLDWGVVVFHDQKLTEQHQIAFATRFGTLQTPRAKSYTGQDVGLMMIGNVTVDGKLGELPYGEMQFHSDQCYYEKPACGSMLFAIDIPNVGGNTLFADCRAAYDDLSADLKERLAGLKALNVYDYSTTRQERRINPDDPQFGHPVIRTHPETGRKGIYVNRLMTDHILDIPREESEELLEILFSKIEEPQYRYEHAWKVGDLLMWDNRRVCHARSDFNPNERRLLRRATIAGDRPF